MSDPYSRFYWRFIDEYPEVYDDKPTFGWWMTLLVIAEGAHPSPAYLPHGVNRKSLNKLVDAGLVELGTGHRFRVKGVQAERERRSEAARVGGLASGRSRAQRTPAEQSLNGRSANGEPKRDETRRDETRRANGSLREIDSLTFDADAYKAEVVAETRRRLGVVE